MTVADVKALVPKNATIRLADLKNETLDINENEYLTSKYDDREIETMYGERYPWIPALGTTLVLKEPKALAPRADKTFKDAAYMVESLYEEAKELSALFGYEEPIMIALNKSRALASIEVATESLEKAKEYIEAQEVY